MQVFDASGLVLCLILFHTEQLDQIVPYSSIIYTTMWFF